MVPAPGGESGPERTLVACAPSGYVALDIDPRHGGTDSTKTLEAEHGRLRSAEVITGGGGRHIWYEWPFDKPMPAGRDLAKGVELKALGNLVVMPPSLHQSGHRYAWHRTNPVETAPAWLEDVPRRRTNGATPAAGQAIPEGQRHTIMVSLAGTFRRAGLTPEEIHTSLDAINTSRCTPPLPAAELRRIADSTTASTHPGTPTPTAYPAPLTDAAWHGIAGMATAAILPFTEADPAAILLQILVGFGSMIGRGPHWTVEGDRHHGNLYLVLVGETAKGRKGSSQSQVRRVIKPADPDWDAACVLGGLASGEGLMHAVRDGDPADDDDEGVTDKRLLVVESEFATVVRQANRDSNILSATLRQAWDSGNLGITKTKPTRATGAHISVVGHITADELRHEFRETDKANGFANRILWAMVRRSKILPEGGSLPDEEVAEIAREIAQRVARAPPYRYRLPRSGRRSTLGRGLPELSDGHPGTWGAVTARAEAQVMRLAMLYALLDESHMIRLDHLRAGLEVWRYCDESAAYAFGDQTGNPIADRIETALRTNGGTLDRTMIRDLFHRSATRAEIDAARNVLTDAKRITVETVQTGGRPREVWSLVS